jgi:hypothetical protein
MAEKQRVESEDSLGAKITLVDSHCHIGNSDGRLQAIAVTRLGEDTSGLG